MLALPVLLLAPSLAAQEPPPGALGGDRGFGQTTRWDPSFNPAIGVAIDAMLEVSDMADAANRYNRFRVRQLEINAASRIDPLGWAFLDFSLNDVEGEESVELEEAAFVMDRFLPGNFSLKAGDFLADFGKWNTVHPHDRPFQTEIGVYREFFGGALFQKGVELHHWFGLGELPLRWSVGLHSSAAGDQHDWAEAEAPGTPFGRRGLDNWGATARVTAQHDAGDNGYFQWGLSGFHAPRELSFVDTTTPAGTVVPNRYELSRSVGVLDLSYRDVDAAQRTSDSVTLELWLGEGEFVPARGVPVAASHTGVWGFAEHSFSPSWSVGCYGSWADRADSPAGEGLLQGGRTTAERGVFASWHLSEFNRLRLQLLHLNPGIGEDKAFVVALQWTVILGSHYHALDW